MELKKIPYELSVCKVRELCPEILADDFCFVGKTDEELSSLSFKKHPLSAYCRRGFIL